MLKIILLVFLLCFVLERVIPGWKLPKVPTWPARVIAINTVQFGVLMLAGVAWERWFASSSLLHVSHFVSPGEALALALALAL